MAINLDRMGDRKVTGSTDGAMSYQDKVKLDSIEAEATADQIASQVAFTPNGDIAATNIQTAIQEVRDDTVTKINEASTGTASANTYTKATLPLSGNSADLALVTDGTINGTPTMAYFLQGKWYRSFDNSLITDQTIDIYLLAGQSNAHGHGSVSALDQSLHDQDGLFYTSWHQSTSGASTTQYYSQWATSLVAGETRGDDNTSVLGGSSGFGAELGFVNRANAINLTNGKPIGILKHAIGASTLTDDGSADGGLSDWDLTATGENRGDALRAFKLAVADALTKLTNAGYAYRLAGFIWWQGESGSNVNGLNALISHVRDWLDANYTLDMPKAQFPFVITKIGYGTDLTPVADADANIGIVDAGSFGHSGSNNHIGTSSNPDTTGTGVNDMFEIGQAFADKMELAISGATNGAWTPSSITTRLWLDMDDQTTFTSTAGNVTSIADKSGNNYTFNSAGGSTLTAVNTSQNGKNILRFDNNSDATNNRSIPFNPTAIHKWFFVVKVTTSDAQDALVTFGMSNPTLQLIMFNLSGNGTFSGDWYTNTGSHLTGNSSNLLNQWCMLSLEIDVPNTRASAFLNGTAYNTNVAQSGLSAFGTGNLKLNDYQNNADSDWGEVVLTENLTQANTSKIEGYLAHKWGIESDLPSAHPYKSLAP